MDSLEGNFTRPRQRPVRYLPSNRQDLFFACPPRLLSNASSFVVLRPHIYEASVPDLERRMTHTGPMLSHEHEQTASPLEELPIKVKEAATFLGVSPQTVYLWVERKQIPHLRVMGRNVRFLRSDLEPFRAQFKKKVENGKTD